ncbi:unnamed protein product [Lathyrus sativus]|nr:unnamed protein product [Lathyrus sativus]
MVMNEFYVDYHHGGYFVDEKYIGGEVSNWKCDGERWSYFEILGVVKEMKYLEVQEICYFEILGVIKKMEYPEVQKIWYDFDGTLKALEDDFGAIEALNWSKTKGKNDIYIVHPIEQTDLVVAIPETQTHEFVRPNLRTQMMMFVRTNLRTIMMMCVRTNLRNKIWIFVGPT